MPLNDRPTLTGAPLPWPLCLRRALRLRCPNCGGGKPFQGLFDMRERCPECRYRFEREPGYFIGAMYFSYFLGVVSLLPVSLPLFAAGVSSWWIGILAVLQMVLLSPLVFRYSRSLWMGFDLVFSHLEERDYETE